MDRPNPISARRLRSLHADTLGCPEVCGTIGSVRARVCSSSLMPPVLRACGKEQKFTYATHAGMPIRWYDVRAGDGQDVPRSVAQEVLPLKLVTWSCGFHSPMSLTKTKLKLPVADT